MMSLYVIGIVAIVVVAFAAIFFWSVLQMARDPGPPTPIDPETRATLAQFEARGRSRSEWEGDHPPVGPKPAA